MTMLPASTDFTGATITEGQFKSALIALRDFLDEKLGDDGSVPIQAFPAGTLMLFQQTSAPTGWTKDMTHNDKALRVVTGTASSGGTTSFSTVLGGSTGGYTLTAADIPAHTHPYGITAYPDSGIGSGTGRWWSAETTLSGTPISATGSNTGGGGSHAHSIGVQYVDLIIASKDA